MTMALKIVLQQWFFIDKIILQWKNPISTAPSILRCWWHWAAGFGNFGICQAAFLAHSFGLCNALLGILLDLWCCAYLALPHNLPTPLCQLIPSWFMLAKHFFHAFCNPSEFFIWMILRKNHWLWHALSINFARLWRWVVEGNCCEIDKHMTIVDWSYLFAIYLQFPLSDQNVHIYANSTHINTISQPYCSHIWWLPLQHVIFDSILADTSRHWQEIAYML